MHISMLQVILCSNKQFLKLWSWGALQSMLGLCGNNSARGVVLLNWTLWCSLAFVIHSKGYKWPYKHANLFQYYLIYSKCLVLAYIPSWTNNVKYKESSFLIGNHLVSSAGDRTVYHKFSLNGHRFLYGYTYINAI